MFNESSTYILSESTQIVLNIGYIVALIGVIWKIAVDHTKNKNEIANLKKEQEEVKRLELAQKELWKDHSTEHKEIKKAMDCYQSAIHELTTKLEKSVTSTELQFKMIETKLDQTQTMILSMQSSNNETQKELIKIIKDMDIERRKK